MEITEEFLDKLFNDEEVLDSITDVIKLCDNRIRIIFKKKDKNNELSPVIIFSIISNIMMCFNRHYYNKITGFYIEFIKQNGMSGKELEKKCYEVLESLTNDIKNFLNECFKQELSKTKKYIQGNNENEMF